MKFIRHIFVAISVLLVFAISGAAEFVGHDDCHSDEAAATDTGNCACVCVCCAASAAPVPATVNIQTGPSAIDVALDAPVFGEDTGRLLESFIFTPPRA